MTGFATLTSKNQLTLPVDMVRLLNWPAGTDLWIKKEEGRVILERIPTIWELREEILSDPKVRRINEKYSTVDIIRLARKIKPPKHLYDY